MSDERPNAIFNIGSQHGNVTNVSGDMTVHGGQHYSASSADMIRQELANLQRAISTIDLDPATRATAIAHLADADREFDRPDPDTRQISRPIKRLTRLLKDVGAISAAGATLIEPLQRIASWLGASGQEILHLIT
jgi:hypothetical protein